MIRFQNITLSSVWWKVWNEARADTDQLEEYEKIIANNDKKMREGGT